MVDLLEGGGEELVGHRVGGEEKVAIDFAHDDEVRLREEMKGGGGRKRRPSVR